MRSLVRFNAAIKMEKDSLWLWVALLSHHGSQEGCVALSAVLRVIGSLNGEPVLLVKERLIGLSKQSLTGRLVVHYHLHHHAPSFYKLFFLMWRVFLTPTGWLKWTCPCYAVKPVPVT